ncbi:hypothetical protein GCM10027055_12820 [Janibacter alkaliphilus]|uniref:Uncharacterized membrane protein YkvA (DUF1232 family) n=1 Tax=Janibacter alkaliphilus TaxID=1069963 RepID=A0A852X5L3_9MICO|nr:YkvA family protein [Janibacter alkaliphilus]NYG37727.1 uncharacterized membrane protein YkvA (DUF1232 family) [Janibacter alkaliphilus]
MAARRRARAAATFAHAVGEASAPGSPSLWRRLRAVPRLVRAVRSGEYTGVSSARLMLLLAGVGYVVSPIDVVPEGLLLVLGLADDALVLGWVALTLVQETEAFLAWEQAVPSHVVR